MGRSSFVSEKIDINELRVLEIKGGLGNSNFKFLIKILSRKIVKRADRPPLPHKDEISSLTQSEG